MHKQIYKVLTASHRDEKQTRKIDVSHNTVVSLTQLHATVTSRLPAGTALLIAKSYKTFPDAGKVSLHK
jgi:hypothetical protein